MKVFEVCYANPSLMSEMKEDVSGFLSKPRKLICLTSNLYLGDGSMIIKQQLLLESLINMFGSGGLFNKAKHSLIRVIVMGGITKLPINSEKVVRGSYNFQKLNNTVYDLVEKSLQYSDDFISNLLRLSPVSLMPGRKDFCSSLLPQKPLPATMFDNSYSILESDTQINIELASNPYNFSLNGKSIILCSGIKLIRSGSARHNDVFQI